MRITRNCNVLSRLFLAVCFVCACSPLLSDGPEMAETAQEDGSTAESGGEGEDRDHEKPNDTMTIRITVGGQVFKADIEASASGKAFLAKLPLTLDMNELNGNEKYCYGISLPRADSHFGTIAAGDLMLYAGNCLVLFYGPAGGYSYTRLGRLQSTAGLAAALGSGSVTVTFAKE